MSVHVGEEEVIVNESAVLSLVVMVVGGIVVGDAGGVFDALTRRGRGKVPSSCEVARSRTRRGV